MNKIKEWLIYSATGILLGFLLGFILDWLWFFFTLFILNYGDSGPSWINTVTDCLFWGGFGVGIIGGQILYVIDRQKKG